MPRFTDLISQVPRVFGRGGFRASVLTLLSGNVAAFVITYGAQLVLARLYTPEEFGVAGYIIRAVGLLTPVAALQYADAIMIPESRREAGTIFWGALLLSLVTSLLLCLPLPFAGAVAGRLVQPEVAGLLAPLLWTVPALLLLARATRLGELWMTLDKRFRPISVLDVVKGGSMAATRIGVGLPPVNAGAGGLVAGFFVANAAGAAGYGGLLARRRFRPPLPRWPELKEAAVRYRRFPLFAAPAALLNTATTVMPTLLFPAFFPSFDVVGLYEQAFRTILVPLSILGGSVSHVFFVHAAEAYRAGTLGPMVLTVHRRIAGLVLFPVLAVMVAGPDLFAFIYGPPWREAGAYAQVLAPWFYLAGVASPLTRIFDVTERQRADFAASFVMFAVLLLALFVGYRSGDVAMGILALGIGGAAGRVFQIGWLLRIAGAPVRPVLGPYLRYGLYALPGLTLAVLAQPSGSEGLVFGAVVAGYGLYGLLVAGEEWRQRGRIS